MSAIQTYHLRCWTLFKAPVEQVWALKTDPDALSDEFKPWVQLETSDPELARQLLRGEGVPGTIPCRLRPGGRLPGIDWPLHVALVEPLKRYVDTSSNPLFSEWHHEHLFDVGQRAVRYVDAVTFTPSRAATARWTARLTKRLFIHRHQRAARRLPTVPRATAIAMLREQLSG